ncbi:DUF5691 domain-containing protein [Hymenobacter weizhouensis]|uniref:DUF5691 domain-containing protein n=1 Tax=Hymenobacter sp. YIM 151500-1 TaxID=2987689 RepID=UPI002226E23A|nr:DUF5691 domain-containing protein [Hymenobacter sp. YIM 151500-1]UYZ63998.1 DUF5691 domain-containing protein [Hymenobacter sp. YIM 151500-1]
MTWTEEQVRALVPDAGTLKRGQDLATPTKWATLGQTATAAWGECKGSGSQPYRTGIDLTGPAFICSCPSRAFPCKHGAGLLLLLARQPQLLSSTAAPAWLQEWLGKRQQTQDKKAAKAAPDAEPAAAPAANPAPTDDARRKREAQRLVRMQRGAQELETWLQDIIRAGLAATDQHPRSFWESQAARLVDGQLPGLAALVRELPALRHQGPDWPARLLARLGELYLLVRAFLRLPELAAEAREEVLQQVGVTVKKEDLLAAQPPVEDEWHVLAQTTTEEERLTVRRSWLRGQGTGRFAVVVEFSFGSQPFSASLVPAGRFRGPLTFYPGLLPLRAVTGALTFAGLRAATDVPAGGFSPTALLHEYAAALARLPWLREWPALLAQVQLLQQPDQSWALYHPAAAPAVLPVRFATEDAPWQLLAQGGGQFLTLFGEWDGQAFRPLASWVGTAAPAKPATSASAAHGASASSAAATLPAASDGGAAGPAPLPSWPQLLRSALLGTRQNGPDLPEPPVGAATSPEQRLLLAAGTAALMRKAGFQPPSTFALPPAPAPAETWEPLGPLGAECLRALLTSNHYGQFRTPYWEQMARHQRLIPPSLLVPALQAESFRQQLPGPWSALLGERGHWLAQLNPDWHPVLAAMHPTDDLTTWETGTLHQRRFFIRRKHESDPEQVRQLLEATLPTEPAATQAALLSELEHHLTPADAPLLEKYLGARSKEVRQTVVPLLVRLPQSGLVERLWQRAAPLLTLKRPLLGRAKLLVTLPEGWNKTWLADGIEQQTADFEGGERAGWLGQLLALLPPSRWAAHLQVPIAELLTLTEASEWRQLLLRAWARAAYLHQDKAVAPLLLLRHFTQVHQLPHQHVTQLMGLLTDEEKLALLRTHLPPQTATAPDFLPEFLRYVPTPWPADIADAALRYAADVLAPAVTNHYAEAYQRLASVLHALARCVPDDQLPRYQQMLTALLEASPTSTSPVTSLVEQVLDALHFRQQLDASLIEPETS